MPEFDNDEMVMTAFDQPSRLDRGNVRDSFIFYQP